MAEHIFLFAVSPVQSYIAQARKTQDLYAGSMILSHLCRQAFKATGLPVERLLFPKMDLTSKEQSLPNRFVAIVKEADLADLEGVDDKVRLHTLGKQAQQAVKEAFMEIAQKVSEPFKKEIPENFFGQVERYLDINWLFLPYQQADYCNIYPRLERLLQGVKQVRAFQPLPEQGRKCAICGERNVKVYRKSSTDGKTECLLKTKLFTTPEQVRVVEEELNSPKQVRVVEEELNSPIQKKFLDPGEGLCAVCYMKRSAELAFAKNEYEKDFPSTSHIALLDAIEKLPRQQCPASPNTYPSDLVLILKDSETRARQNAQSAKEFNEAKRIYDALQEHGIPFGPYYALLHFDGDSMGKWLSGEHLQDQAQLEPFHRQLSEKLADFAQKARDYLQHPSGRAVYAGGDDFLGFVNLASLFEVLKYLRKQFDEQINKPLFEGEKAFALTDDARLSFSAGVAVAHYKTPLGEVLKWARNMEKSAKAQDGKDAFAIAVLKHSGEIQQTVFPWRMKDDKQSNIWTTDNFEQLMAPLLAKQFSCKFLVNIDREFRGIMNDEEPKTLPFELPKEAFAAEVRRLIDRACLMKPQPDQSRKAFQDKKNTEITNLAKHVTRLSFVSRHSFENFLSALDVINFLTRKGNL